MSAASRFELSPEARSRGIRLLAFHELASTNDECRRLIGEGERGPLWVIAERQTKGRGRLGREWISPLGNLHASLVLSGAFPANVAPQLGFVAGVAALRAMRRATRLGDRLKLKWPNDLLLDGGKLGGILLEGVSSPTGDPRMPTQTVAIIGIGVNCALAPEGLPYPARALRDIEGDFPTAPQIFSELADSFAQALDLWSDAEGFAAIREQWLNGAAGLGEPIKVSLSQAEELHGLFKTIDASGRLVVEITSGDRLIAAGDVFLTQEGPGSHL